MVRGQADCDGHSSRSSVLVVVEVVAVEEEEAAAAASAWRAAGFQVILRGARALSLAHSRRMNACTLAARERRHRTIAYHVRAHGMRTLLQRPLSPQVLQSVAFAGARPAASR